MSVFFPYEGHFSLCEGLFTILGGLFPFMWPFGLLGLHYLIEQDARKAIRVFFFCILTKRIYMHKQNFL